MCHVRFSESFLLRPDSHTDSDELCALGVPRLPVWKRSRGRRLLCTMRGSSIVHLDAIWFAIPHQVSDAPEQFMLVSNRLSFATCCLFATARQKSSYQVQNRLPH